MGPSAANGSLLNLVIATAGLFAEHLAGWRDSDDDEAPPAR
jgi:hypothetical protein